ncbi:hypothetical protein [Pedobacter sp. R20-19]|uniref:hypothetical protein n=1 Tax=Pedobacter sp. R20-19 TaxID=1270196 RepID=UPI0012FBDD7D|nr:hypothetical protein [Pedobacter sp. R20-19]
MIVFSCKLFAQSGSGCYVSSTTTFAVTSVGNAGPANSSDIRPTYTGSLALANSTTCPRVKSFGNNRGANTCYIRTSNSAGFTYTSGNLYDYERENCPLDDYIWLMLIAIGGFAFTALRKYHLA